VKAITVNEATANARCKSELAIPELDQIRQKVELFRLTTDGAPPFSIISNDTFPADAEMPVIARWAAIRDGCIKRSESLLVMPSSVNTLQRDVLQQQFAGIKDIDANVGELILALYRQKLTYGEFGRKRYEIVRDAMAASTELKQAAIDRDQQRQALAQRQFASALAAWSVYMQAVNARQPQTVYIDGTIRVVR
jgi:hypothetical protein